ncbi:helix-turn-helix domain-containing protein [Flavisericum labens]|uniref:helix-turn-helix domain-containing protein n=1 Tax=Flavisericum labens TaxID=3377112 RepID=UPI00387A976C
MARTLFIGFLMLVGFAGNAQYKFTGHIDNNQWHNYVYLSVIEDYRKISGVYFEQIVARTSTDSLGYFSFKGNQLESKNRIYRIHVDNCFENEQNQNHFDGHCDDSKEVVFIAKNTDTIVLPVTFGNQMFCDIKSTNQKSSAFVKIDSLKEEMKFAFSEFRSEANRKLNTKKWFETLQDYGKNLNEPLAELYVYSFLSNRGNNFHEHYLEDLKNNDYYEGLLFRLEKRYPNSTYSSQYKSELNSDKYIINSSSESAINWNYLLYILLAVSVSYNLWFWLSNRKHKINSVIKAKEQLTKQEQNILDLLLLEKTNKEIADALFVSISTVKTHINNIYKKLNVQSRKEVKSLFNKTI